MIFAVKKVSPAAHTVRGRLNSTKSCGRSFPDEFWCRLVGEAPKGRIFPARKTSAAAHMAGGEAAGKPAEENSKGSGSGPLVSEWTAIGASNIREHEQERREK